MNFEGKKDNPFIINSSCMNFEKLNKNKKDSPFKMDSSYMK